jgi:predicted Kef-type K+ transport protein
MCLLILLLTFVLKKFSQPYLGAYILAGVLMGPYFAGVLTEVEDTASIGELGILLLMFFLGMELDIPDRRSLLIKPVIAPAHADANEHRPGGHSRLSFEVAFDNGGADRDSFYI